MKLKTQTSDRIELNPGKIYGVTDFEQLATIFFPQSTGKQLRSSFIAIFCEIKNSNNQKIISTDYIAEKYKLLPSSVTKARIKMSRIGLITHRQQYWQFSSKFVRSLHILSDKIETFKLPAENLLQKKKELFMIEITKGGE